MNYTTPSAADPFLLNNNTVYPVSYNYDGKTGVLPTLVGGESTAVLIPYGDSLASCSDNVAYLPANTRVHNLSLHNGGMYDITTPLVGCTNNTNPAISGTWSIRLADKLRTAGTYGRVVIMPIAVGGSQSSDWAASGTLSSRLVTAYRRLQAIGLDTANVFWLQSLGANDRALGVTAAAMRANLNSAVAVIRGAGSTAPILMAKSSYSFGATTGGSAIITGITDAKNDNAGVYFGADYDTITAAGRYDTTHFNATGSDTAANLWQAAIAALP